MRAQLLWAGAMLGSIAGRTVIILTLGITLAVAASLMIAEQVRLRDLEQLRRTNLVGSIATVIDALRQQPTRTERALENGQINGIRIPVDGWPEGTRDAEAGRLLSARLRTGEAPEIVRVRAPRCAADRQTASQDSAMPPIDCWYVRFTLPVWSQTFNHLHFTRS